MKPTSTAFTRILYRFLPCERAPSRPCFHCGEQMREDRAIVARFQEKECWVCCHACQAILRTVESHAWCEIYLREREQRLQKNGMRA